MIFAKRIIIGIGVLLALSVPAGPDAQENAAANVQIGPGRVTLTLSPSGQWLTFTPSWDRELRLITRGGFVVLSGDGEGGIIEIANSELGAGLRNVMNQLSPAHEGISGGARRPLPAADDDGDGIEDEDRLDGVDNDGDGDIDEDFAAIGDEMVVRAWQTTGTGGPSVLLHQECYAWSLPHIDGMITMKLTVTNTGRETIDDLRIGAVFHSEGDVIVSTQELSRATGDRDHPFAATTVTVSEANGSAAAMLLFAEPREGETSWLSGTAEPGRQVAQLVGAAAPADIGLPPLPGTLPLPQSPGTAEANMSYGISPVLGSLEPGDEAFVYVVLLAVPSRNRLDRAIDDAYRTVVGDGRYRMVPPPVSITRRVLRGTYKIDTELGGELIMRLHNLRDEEIGALDIDNLSGVDLKQFRRTESFDGDVYYEKSGDLPEAFSRGGRVTLRGRLTSGETFDVVLKPVMATELSDMGAEQYWREPGKLDEALLTGLPNPFRETTTIHYEVPSSLTDEFGAVLSFSAPVETSVKVYNVAGRLVSVLVENIQNPGTYNVPWAALDAHGRNVASGVYYVKLQIGKKHITKRLTQLK